MITAVAGEPVTVPPTAAPLIDPILTTEGLELDHVPPVGLPTSVSPVLGQRGAPPVGGTGLGATVTVIEVAHVVAVAVYVITWVPSATPVTVPDGVTVAAPPPVVENVPGVVASANTTEVPLHNNVGPVGVAGGGYMDIASIVRQP